MNLEYAIHARWAADATLYGLLPSTRLFTGNYFSQEPTLPYAILTMPGGAPDSQHNDYSAVDEVVVRFQIVHHRDNYDELKAIAEACKAVFNRADFALSGSDSVLTMERGNDGPLQDDESGEWSWVLDFRCKVYLDAGV